MNKKLLALTSLGIGAGLMYIFDPSKGKDRRNYAQEKVTGAVTQSFSAIKKTSGAIGFSAKSAITGVSRKFFPKPDEKLLERVREKVSQLVTNHQAIDIASADGQITLYGEIPAIEVDVLLKEIYGLKGVKAVDNKLNVHKRSTDVCGPVAIRTAV